MGTRHSGESGQVWRAGELAKAAGVTVRALHYYDEIGLLSPSRRSAVGHRLYDGTDVARLYRISLLRRLGFPLEQIASVLEDPAWQLRPAVERHLRHTRAEAEIASRLCARLSSVAGALAKRESPSPAQLFATMEEMSMLDDAIRSTTSLLVYDDLSAAHEYLTGVYGLRGVTAMTVIAVDDADAHHARSADSGADIIKEPVDQPYGVREYGARDLEGHLWYFQSPLADLTPGGRE